MTAGWVSACWSVFAAGQLALVVQVVKDPAPAALFGALCGAQMAWAVGAWVLYRERVSQHGREVLLAAALRSAEAALASAASGGANGRDAGE